MALKKLDSAGGQVKGRLYQSIWGERVPSRLLGLVPGGEGAAVSGAAEVPLLDPQVAAELRSLAPWRRPGAVPEAGDGVAEALKRAVDGLKEAVDATQWQPWDRVSLTVMALFLRFFVVRQLERAVVGTGGAQEGTAFRFESQDGAPLDIGFVPCSDDVAAMLPVGAVLPHAPEALAILEQKGSRATVASVDADGRIYVQDSRGFEGLRRLKCTRVVAKGTEGGSLVLTLPILDGKALIPALPVFAQAAAGLVKALRQAEPVQSFPSADIATMACVVWASELFDMAMELRLLPAPSFARPDAAASGLAVLKGLGSAAIGGLRGAFAKGPGSGSGGSVPAAQSLSPDGLVIVRGHWELLRAMLSSHLGS